MRRLIEFRYCTSELAPECDTALRAWMVATASERTPFLPFF